MDQAIKAADLKTIRARESFGRSRTDVLLTATTRTLPQANGQHQEERLNMEGENGMNSNLNHKANLKDAGTRKLLVLKSIRK